MDECLNGDLIPHIAGLFGTAFSLSVPFPFPFPHSYYHVDSLLMTVHMQYMVKVMFNNIVITFCCIPLGHHYCFSHHQMQSL